MVHNAASPPLTEFVFIISGKAAEATWLVMRVHYSKVWSTFGKSTFSFVVSGNLYFTNCYILGCDVGILMAIVNIIPAVHGD